MTLKPLLFIGILILGIGASFPPTMSLTKPLKETRNVYMAPVHDSTKIVVAGSWIHIAQDINISQYFDYMDSLINVYDSVVPYPLSEHLLAHANPWIIDTLANTDYYRLQARDSFVYDQRKLLVLRLSDSIIIPDSVTASNILNSFKKTNLDINIPEFKLRIYQGSSLLFTFPVRVGKNTKKYLAMIDKTTDLRTKSGIGKVVRHEKDPDFYNPVNHERFYTTKRDDNKTTLMPQIPWIETEINGIRNGQMIHPTTNPETLGKASSNGCIGTRESDAWIIYYYAPLETRITIRYHLEFINGKGENVKLKDIYGYVY
ncbi:L,D-transpeptidase [uncultured Eudoraea sp.]|uniref:L,D-transpeptidase n=1 Tax=uncultured Eudoraea sp. TaxID=1035614 RepID=UPI0026163822|nr:L,D-transpeptidase [uncultured Eudoraea sp.]